MIFEAHGLTKISRMTEVEVDALRGVALARRASEEALAMVAFSDWLNRFPTRFPAASRSECCGWLTGV